MDPVLVTSVHGIRTYATWQKDLQEVLNDNGLRFRRHDYDYYPIHRFLRKRSNVKMVEEFYARYQQIVQECKDRINLKDPTKRPSIIAHSFGTFLVAYAMLKYDGIRYDKIILCGSILPRNFDWRVFFVRDQVNLVLNEYGSKDIWTKTVGYFVADTGTSGAEGFAIDSPVFVQRRFKFHRHSDFFSRQHIEEDWIPFLRQDSSTLAVVHGRGLDRDQLIGFMKLTAGIDELCYGECPGIKDAEVSLRLGIQWIEINPDIYTFLIDRRTNQPVGYINAMPITPSLFERIKTAGIRDNEVTAADLLPFEPESSIRMYCMSIAIHPDARRKSQGLFSEPVEKLLNGFCAKLKEYAVHQRTTVSEMVGIAWTDVGKKMSELLGMKPIAKDEFGHAVYFVNMQDPPSPRTYSCVQNLIQWYREN